MVRSVCLVVVSVALAAPVWAGGDGAEWLSRKIETFQAVGTLDKAAEALASAGKVKIVVEWDALTAAGVGREARAVVRARDATVEELLDMLVLSASEKDVPLGWHVDGKTIRVTTRAAVEDRRPARSAPPVRPVTTATPTRQAATADRSSAAPAKPSATAVRQAAAAGAMVVEYTNTPLGEVVNHLRDKTGLDIVVNWNALEEVGIAKDSPVSLTLRNRPAGKVLDLILADVSGSRDKFEKLYYVIDDGVVLISTGAALNTTTKTVVTDIRDLLVLAPEFKGPSMNLAMSGNRNNNNNNGNNSVNLGDLWDRDSGTDRSGETAATMAEQRAVMEERIIQAVKDSIGDDMWQPDGKGSIRIFQGKLIVTQTPLGFKLLSTVAR